MKPTPKAIKNAARAMLSSEKWSSFWSEDDARALAGACLSADLGDMVLVPMEPTAAMIEAAVVAGHQANKPFVERIKSRSFEAGMSSDITAGDGRIYRAAYRAMIEAARTNTEPEK